MEEGRTAQARIQVPAISTGADPLFHDSASGVLELCDPVVNTLSHVLEPLRIFSHCDSIAVSRNIISLAQSSIFCFCLFHIFAHDLEVQVLEPLLLLDAWEADVADIFNFPVDVV